MMNSVHEKKIEKISPIQRVFDDLILSFEKLIAPRLPAQNLFLLPSVSYCDAVSRGVKTSVSSDNVMQQHSLVCHFHPEEEALRMNTKALCCSRLSNG